VDNIVKDWTLLELVEFLNSYIRVKRNYPETCRSYVQLAHSALNELRIRSYLIAMPYII